MVTKILRATARLDDSAAMQTLLAPIPDGDELGRQLASRQPGLKARYFDEGRKGLYVVSDGKTVTCFTVTDVTVEQAATIRAECDSIEAWNYQRFQAAVERALSASFDRVQ